MLSRRIFRSVIMALLLLALSISVWAIKTGSLFYSNGKVKKTTVGKKKAKKYNTQVLNRFKQVLEGMDTRKEELYMSGMFSIKDYSEQDAKAINVSYLYSKKGSDYYYKLGNTETYNAKGLNIYINHDLKKVQLSGQVTDSTSSPVRVITENLLKNLKGEDYDLVAKPIGKMQTISLLNSHHVTCKEYSVTFDTLSLNVSKVFIRLTNLSDPLRTDNEKHIQYVISTSEMASHIDRYLNKSIVEKENGEWHLTAPYKNYELIR